MKKVLLHIIGILLLIALIGTSAYMTYLQKMSATYYPEAWHAVEEHDANGNWQPVEEPDGYPIAKGEPCTVNFKPVKTKALKLEVTMNKRLSGGVFEWIVK